MQNSYYVDVNGKLHPIVLKDTDGTDIVLLEDHYAKLDEETGEVVQEMEG